MSEWKKAREAAAHAICEFIRSDCLKCPFNNDPAHAITRGCQAVASQAANAALSAFEREGFVLVPREATTEMIRCGWHATERIFDISEYVKAQWSAMITAAIKDRT